MKKYKIIYDDQDLLVVCKFAGLAVQSARVSTPDLMSLLRNEMLERGEKKPYLGLVNRLDQPVEGIVLIGKNEKAAADLSRQVTDHIHMEKWYQTVVCGKLEQREDTLVDYLLKDSRTNTSKVVKEGTPGSKRSELHLHINHIVPPYSLHIALVFLTHSIQKGTRKNGNSYRTSQHDLPQR